MLHPDQARAPHPAFRAFNVVWGNLQPRTYQLLSQPAPNSLPVLTLRQVIHDLFEAGTRVGVTLKLLQLWVTEPKLRRRLRGRLLSVREDHLLQVRAGVLPPAPRADSANQLLNHLNETYAGPFTLEELQESAKEALNMAERATKRGFAVLRKQELVAVLAEPSNQNQPGVYVSKLVFGQLDFVAHLREHFLDATFTINDVVASCAQSGTPLTPRTARIYMTYLFKRKELHRAGLNPDEQQLYTLTAPAPKVYRNKQLEAATVFRDHLYARYGYWPFEAWAQELARDYGKAGTRTIVEYLTLLRQHNLLKLEAAGCRNTRSIYRLLPEGEQQAPKDVQAEVDRLLSLPSVSAAAGYQLLKQQFGTDTVFAASYSQLSQLLGRHRNSVILLLTELQARGYLWREPFGGGTQQPSKYMLFDV